MMRILFLTVLILVSACTATQVSQTLTAAEKMMENSNAPTTTEVGAGLKEALEKGIATGSEALSKTDGYLGNPSIRIPFPPEVQSVEDKLRKIGLGKDVDRFVTTINRGAEAAASEAKPIFVEAIRNMTVEDAWSVLNGPPDAATRYLERTTSSMLKDKFKPHIQEALNATNATRYYGDLIGTYNKIPFVEKVNPDLNDYVTSRAMQGLFYVIAEEEKKIRDNPLERTTELLQKVFGYKK